MQSHVKSLARIESFWVFNSGFNSFINNISNIRQSNFDLHFIRTENCLSVNRPCCSKCLPIAEHLCSLMRWYWPSNIYVSARISTSLPTFARLDEPKLRIWKKSADNFQKQVISRHIAIVRILSSLQKSHFQSLVKTHAQKIVSLDLQESRRWQTH